MGSTPSIEPESSAPTTAPDAAENLTALGAPVSLRDGSRVRIRQGRPSDAELLVRGFYRLSPTSSYRRFFSASPVITRETVNDLTDIDHRDHEAIVALDERGTEGLGIAHYLRSPERADTAEVALTVIDDWQGPWSRHAPAGGNQRPRARRGSIPSPH